MTFGKMLDFTIDNAKCTQCGLCSQECPTLIINGKNGIPVIKEGKEKNCIKCQHCLAVCPTGALSIFGKNPENSISTNAALPQTESLSNLIKTRRSIRRFKDEDVAPELIKSLLSTTAFAPTGHNKNAVLFSICENKTDFAKVRTTVYAAIKKAKESNSIPPSLAFIGDFQNLWDDKGIDVLFRNAPHYIIASAPKNTASSAPDCVASLTYFELLANTYGIGTLWNGFMQMVLENIAPELKTSFGIPEDHVIGYSMVFGKPAIKFARSIQSDGLNINKIKL